MKKILLLALFICLSIEVNAQQPKYEWAFDIGVDNFSENSFSIATDSKDNVFVVGYIEAPTDFAPGDESSVVRFPGTLFEPNFVLAKYSPNKEFQWAKIVSCRYIPDTAQDFDNQSFRIAIDGNDNVYVVGNFRGNIDFDPSEGEFVLSNNTDYYRYFIAKYDENGNFITAKTINGSSTLDIFFGSLSICKFDNNDILISGSFKNQIEFDPSRPEYSASADSWQTFFAKYSPNLDFISAKTMEAYRTFNMKIDKQNNIYIAGYINGRTDFDPSESTFFVETTMYMDSYLAKYDPNGALQWVLSPSASESDDFANRLAIDSTGNIYLIGSYTTSVSFAGQGITYKFDGPDGGYNGYILKCDNLGKILKAEGLFGITNDAVGLEVTKDNRVIAAGNFGGNISIGDIDLEADGYYQEAFLAAYDDTLRCLSAFKIGSIYYDGMSALALDLQNNILCTGYFTETVDFDPSNEEALLYSPNPAEPGLYYDIFVAKYSMGNHTKAYEQIGGNRFSLSPNPAHGEVWLSLPEAQTLRDVRLINQFGEEIKCSYSYGSNSLNLEGLPAGLYFVRIETDSGLFIEKLIKH